MSRKLNLVVAACDNMGIGVNGTIPWRLKKDMAFFKKITKTTQHAEKKNAVIMGRKTWESIPPKFRPLEGRLNIILSTQLPESPPGTVLVRNFCDALNAIDDCIENIFVIGGASVYREAMMAKESCRIYLTRINGTFECDTFFPDIDETVFKRIENCNGVESGPLEENGINFSFQVYEKF